MAPTKPWYVWMTYAQNHGRVTVHAYRDQMKSIKMADPKYADLRGIVRYLDKYLTIFVMCAVV